MTALQKILKVLKGKDVGSSINSETLGEQSGAGSSSTVNMVIRKTTQLSGVVEIKKLENSKATGVFVLKEITQEFIDSIPEGKRGRRKKAAVANLEQSLGEDSVNRLEAEEETKEIITEAKEIKKLTIDEQYDEFFDEHEEAVAN